MRAFIASILAVALLMIAAAIGINTDMILAWVVIIFVFAYLNSRLKRRSPFRMNKPK